MKKVFYCLVVFLTIIGLSKGAVAKIGYVDVPINGVQQTTTVTGIGLPPSFGPQEQFYTVFRIYPLLPGKRYEATLTYDAGTDMGYAHNWQDGEPTSKDALSFVGIGTGTGSRAIKDKEEKFLFTVDSQSTSNVLYVILRSYKAWTIRFSVKDRLSGVTRESQDRWGYYHVTDFDFNKTSPFLLKRGGLVSPQTAEASPSVRTRIIGPLSFHAGQLAGTIKCLQFSENEGIVWLRVDGTNVEEILNAGFRGNEMKFVRTVDCRFNVPRPLVQVYTGQISADGSISGSYSNDYGSVLMFPWEARIK